MNDDFYYFGPRPKTQAEWRALPEDVMAGVFEEIMEWREHDRADQHWAWPFVAAFIEE